MNKPRTGILTGISYVSGLDYYESINRLVCAGSDAGEVMKPNPELVMVSVDCDRYVQLLTANRFDEVGEYLLGGVSRLVDAGCNLLVIASNTGHICVPAVNKAYPDLEIIHIADCAAARIREMGISRIGLLGTKPTMEEDYLKARLALHQIETLIPESTETRDRIYDIICQELSFNEFRDDSRDFIVAAIQGLKDKGAEACLLGCTEIEMLVEQKDIADVDLLPSAEIHISAVVEILLGQRNPADLLPGQ